MVHPDFVVIENKKEKVFYIEHASYLESKLKEKVNEYNLKNGDLLELKFFPCNYHSEAQIIRNYKANGYTLSEISLIEKHCLK